MIEALVGLGGNLGECRRNLRCGLFSLGVPIAAVSSLYRSRAVETDCPQPDYLNAVAALLLPEGYDPEALLGRLLHVERVLGRERSRPKAPRTLDLDLLLYGDAARCDPGLCLPHPGILRRRFVLEPLLEIRPHAALPDKVPLASRLSAVADQDVRRVAGRCWWWRNER